MNPKIAKIVVGLPVEGPFDYQIPDQMRDEIREGMRVSVLFCHRPALGVVVGFRAKSEYEKLNPILSLLDNNPCLGKEALAFTKDLACYYGCSWGEAIETSLPNGLRKRKSFEFGLPVTQDVGEDKPFLKKGAGCPSMILCHDQDGTKRWPFILEQIEKALAKQQGILFLVPEVQAVKDIESRLAGVGAAITVLDKKLSGKKELDNWKVIKEGQARIVIGTRSAVFAPVTNLGLIVVYDEEHSFYKQEQSPFYHVREVVKMRAPIEGCAVLFVSSAPSAELFHEIRKKKISVETFPPETLSEMRLVDLSQYKYRKRSILSYPLQAQMQSVLDKKGKIVLLFNRRGFSTMTRCNKCGWTVQCERCSVSLTYLYTQKKLACYLCNYTAELPKECPQCKGPYLRSTGRGIEKVESEVARLFPRARVATLDRETKSVPSKADVIIATQAVIKWLPKMKIDLMGVLDIDQEMNRIDFHSAQKVFSLLIHLRQSGKSRILVQTNSADNYCLKAAMKADFKRFYQKEIAFRRESGLPPFSHLIAIVLRGPEEEKVWEKAKALHTDLALRSPKGCEVLEVQPDTLPRLRDQYRLVILIKGKSVPRMLPFIKNAIKGLKRKAGVIITVNVDP